MDKSPDAFRTISEVADWLNTPAHVLRFWESRFSQVKPVKRAGGRRYYRPADMALLGGIKKLLHDDGMTIRGVQKLLRENGVRYVAAMSPEIEGVAPITAPNLPQQPIAVPSHDSPSMNNDVIPEAPMAEDVPTGAFDVPQIPSVVPFARPDNDVYAKSAEETVAASPQVHDQTQEQQELAQTPETPTVPADIAPTPSEPVPPIANETPPSVEAPVAIDAGVEQMTPTLSPEPIQTEAPQSQMDMPIVTETETEMNASTADTSAPTPPSNPALTNTPSASKPFVQPMFDFGGEEDLETSSTATAKTDDEMSAALAEEMSFVAPEPQADALGEDIAPAVAAPDEISSEPVDVTLEGPVSEEDEDVEIDATAQPDLAEAAIAPLDAPMVSEADDVGIPEELVPDAQVATPVSAPEPAPMVSAPVAEMAPVTDIAEETVANIEPEVLSAADQPDMPETEAPESDALQAAPIEEEALANAPNSGAPESLEPAPLEPAPSEALDQSHAPEPIMASGNDVPADPQDDDEGLDVPVGVLGRMSVLKTSDPALLLPILARADALHKSLSGS
jgi:DNA-binding transcriptional MerR regulator